MYIPLYQTCKLYKKGISDGWGGKTNLAPVELRCRFSEGSRALKNVSNAEETRGVRSKEIVPEASIFFRQLPDIDLEDEIEFTNELGKTLVYHPISISVIRGVSGYPLYTRVDVGAK